MKGPLRAAVAAAGCRDSTGRPDKPGAARPHRPAWGPSAQGLPPHPKHGPGGPPARERPPISHHKGPTPLQAPAARPSSWSQHPRPPGSPRHSGHVPVRPVSARHTVSVGPARRPALSRQLGRLHWPSPASPAHPRPAPGPWLRRALFPDSYLAGPLAEARSLLKRHLPAASLRLPPANGARPQPQGPEGCGPAEGRGQALPLCSPREPHQGQRSPPGCLPPQPGGRPQWKGPGWAPPRLSSLGCTAQGFSSVSVAYGKSHIPARGRGVERTSPPGQNPSAVTGRRGGSSSMWRGSPLTRP